MKTENSWLTKAIEAAQSDPRYIEEAKNLRLIGSDVTELPIDVATAAVTSGLQSLREWIDGCNGGEVSLGSGSGSVLYVSDDTSTGTTGPDGSVH